MNTPSLMDSASARRRAANSDAAMGAGAPASGCARSAPIRHPCFALRRQAGAPEAGVPAAPSSYDLCTLSSDDLCTLSSCPHQLCVAVNSCVQPFRTQVRSCPSIAFWSRMQGWKGRPLYVRASIPANNWAITAPTRAIDRPHRQQLAKQLCRRGTVGDGGDAERAERGKRRDVHQRRPDVDAERHRERIAATHLLHKPGHRGQERGQYDAGCAAVGRDERR